jgi:hypothetical protein
VINGSGFVWDTAYLIKETNANVDYLTHPSTSLPWSTVSTGFFSVSSAGHYTVRVTSNNTSNGLAQPWASRSPSGLSRRLLNGPLGVD